MSHLQLDQAEILIDLAQQKLYLPKYNKQYLISTGKNGIGEAENSGKTPRGWHKVAEKFGQQAPLNSVFIARQATGEIYNAELAQQFPQRDWILSRILWLSGLEKGFHGTPDSEPMGIPMSHGCIRMRNTDVAELFELVSEDALVYISEQPLNLTI